MRTWLSAVVAGVLCIPLAGCLGQGAASDSSDSQREFPLSTLPTSTVKIGTNSFRAWLATTPEQQAEGLMFVPESEIADDQGMLFVFPSEELRGFWMKNTITSLDIAFARLDGTIVAIHTMPPLTLRTFSSIEPAMFALEVKAGTFERLHVAEGDRIEIPAGLLKSAP